MSAVIDDQAHGHDHAHGPAKGLMRWVLTTNHKDIGTMYLWFSFIMFLLGGSFAMVIRPNCSSQACRSWSRRSSTR